MFFYYFLIAVLCLLGITFLIAFFCYKRVFYSPPRKRLGDDEYLLPEGDIYEPFHDRMLAWMKETRAMPYERVSITSFDGLTLRGRYYEYQKGAPVELLFHGYKSNSERDLCGGVQRCFALGRNVLLVDHRASGESDGNVITFGINERKDCLKWIDFVIEKFGKDVKIMLGGISMGAATVLMAGGEKLPKNVVCIVGLMFSHHTSNIHAGPTVCLYKRLPSMREKVEAQISLAETIRAVDQRGVVEKVLSSHFLPDIMGNSRAFSKQKVRCTKCGAKYRRMPLTGKCKCGGNLILSVSKGSVTKYLEISQELVNRYPVSHYLKQRLEIQEYGINSLFESDKSKQSSLDVFF